MIDYDELYDNYLYDCYIANKNLIAKDWETYGKEKHHIEVPDRDGGLLTPTNSQDLTTYQHWVAGILQSEVRGKCCFAMVPKGVLPPFLDSLRAKWVSEHVAQSTRGITPEQRSEASRKGRAAMTAEERSEIARKGRATMTPEQRSKSARQSWAKRTPEERSETARKRLASMTPEERSEASRKARMSKTPEERVAISVKAAETRRRRAALRSLGRDQSDAIWSDG